MSEKRLVYIDGLSSSQLKRSGPGLSVLNSFRLSELNSTIDGAMRSLKTFSEGPSKPTIILDGLDFALACEPTLNALDAQQFLTSLQERSLNVIATCSADSPLLHNIDASSTPLELEHSTFLRSAAYQTSLIFQLRPLETGQAKDVSGTLQVSYGGAHEARKDELAEGEWLFHVKSDGSVKVWARGE